MKDKIYYLVHSVSFGDTLAATPTLRYLCTSHNSKIHVVTHNKQIFNSNPYVASTLSFEEYNNLSTKDVTVYHSFTSPGKVDGNNIEKKFSHIDIRQLHAMDLGFQLTPENMHYDYFPDVMQLDVNLPDKYVVLHITNNWPNRTWEYEKWRELIQWLSDNKIFTVLIGFGHREIVHQSISNVPLEKQCPTFHNLYGVDMANKGTMSDMWHIINRAQCIVTMDTGPLHLAGTTDTHIIQLGSAIHPSLRAPYRNGSQNYKYNYIGGDCNLFCNSNLLYSVKEWGHVNAVPPQTACLENYTEFKCHPNVHTVKSVLKGVIGITDPILTNVMWDVDKFVYNFNRNIGGLVDVVIKDTHTGFKMYNTLHENPTPIKGGYYWSAIAPDSHIRRDSTIDVIVNGEFVESHNIKRESSDIFYVNDIPIDNTLLNLEVNKDSYFMTFYEVFLNNTYNRYGVSVEEGDVVLDIGANCGFFTLYSLMNGCSEVIAVEPDPDCFSILQNLSNTFDKIQLLNYAVHSDGELELNLINGSSAGNYISGINYTPNENTNITTIKVPSIHINTLITGLNSKIDLLKLDCEGAEEFIISTIADDILYKIPKLIIEAHTTAIKDLIKEKLESFGYVVSVDNVTDSVYMLYCKKEPVGNLIDILNDKIDTVDSINIVLSYADTNYRKSLLEKCVTSIGGNSVLISSHYPVSTEMQKNVRFILYDRINPLLYEKDFKKYNLFFEYTSTDENGYVSAVENFKYEHSYAVYTLIQNALRFAKSVGNEYVNIINYDYILNNSIITQHAEYLHSEYDLVFYKQSGGASYSMGIFSGKINAILEFFDKYNSIDDFYSHNSSVPNECMTIECRLFRFYNETSYKIKELVYEDLKNTVEVDLVTLNHREDL